tara:strand:+ start:1090 stop:2076 length:987 start_codon:yes stop_codon:yes gene_type:complete
MTMHIHADFIKAAAFVLLGSIVAGCQSPSLVGAKNVLTLKSDTPANVENAPLREARQTIPVSGTVVVQDGDNLYRIATRYQVTPQSIIRDNDLVAPYNLYSGQVLRVKPSKTHVVKIADSLFSLSQRYAVSQFELARLNQLSEPYALTVGQVLLLPETLDLSVLQIDGLVPDKVTTTTTAAPSSAPVLQSKKQPVKTFVAPSLGKSGFTWPLEGEVTTEFGPVERGVHHDGVKISAPFGTLVTTSAPGTVAFVGTELKRFGTLVLVKHEGGYITAYAHLDVLSVKEGDVLSDGTVIGQVGTTGYVDTPQLHFEIRKSRTPINPRELIS